MLKIMAIAMSSNNATIKAIVATTRNGSRTIAITRDGRKIIAITGAAGSSAANNAVNNAASNEVSGKVNEARAPTISSTEASACRPNIATVNTWSMTGAATI